ncbi:MAG TPA: cation-transporting P-type ATPase [Kofleriaceae bacterium]
MAVRANELDIAKLCSLAPEQRYDALGCSPHGLTADEAERRIARYGPNATRRSTSYSWIRALVTNFTHPLALLLWLGAAMAFAARAPELAIVCVVVINGVFAFLQEYRAERVVEALLARAALSARVVRGGNERIVPAAELVPGDLVVLAAGDVVPADCVLVRADGLSLDLSLLTGETMPVSRTVDAGAGADRTARTSRAIDRALLGWTAASDPDALRIRHPRLAAVPFDPDHRYKEAQRRGADPLAEQVGGRSRGAGEPNAVQMRWRAQR